MWQSLLDVAQEDLEAARVLIAADLTRTAAFHLQQAAEKMLKGILTAERIPYRGTQHSLVEMLALLPTQHVFRLDFADISGFEAYATSFRYPTPTGRIPQVRKEDNLKAALENMSRIMSEVREHCAEIRDDMGRQ